MPRRLGEILRESGLLAAAIGGVLALALAARRARRAPRGRGRASLAVVAFCILAAGGLPIRTRYLMLTACILAVFAGRGAVRLAGDRRTVAAHGRGGRGCRRSRCSRVRRHRAEPGRPDRAACATRCAPRSGIQDDLGEAVARAPCTPYVVPNRRPVPLVALWRDVTPGSIVDAQEGFPASGDATSFPRRRRGRARLHPRPARPRPARPAAAGGVARAARQRVVAHGRAMPAASAG